MDISDVLKWYQMFSGHSSSILTSQKLSRQSEFCNAVKEEASAGWKKRNCGRSRRRRGRVGATGVGLLSEFREEEEKEGSAMYVWTIMCLFLVGLLEPDQQ